MAAQFGVRWAAEPVGSGLNGAVSSGASLAAANQASHLLILPSDLPFLERIELERLIGQARASNGQPSLFLCGDEQQQGTNAMILPTGLGFQFRYGRTSFNLHQQEASRLGLACQIMQLPSLQFDLDTEQDYDLYTKKYAPTLF